MSTDVALLRAELAELGETVAALRAQVEQTGQVAGTLADLVKALREQKPPTMPQPIVNVDIPPAPKPQVHVQMPPPPAPMAAPASGDYDIEHEWDGNRIVRSTVIRRQARSH